MKYNPFNLSLREAFDALKRLSKSIYWQTIYNNAKEYRFKLFQNVTDFTSLQLEFLYLLGYYSNIYAEVGAGTLSEKILEDDIYIEAYYFYKRKFIKDEKKKAKTELITNKLQDKINFLL